MKLNYIPHANWMFPTVSIMYEKTYFSSQDKRMHMYIFYLNTFGATIFPAYLIIVSNAFRNNFIYDIISMNITVSLPIFMGYPHPSVQKKNQ